MSQPWNGNDPEADDLRQTDSKRPDFAFVSPSPGVYNSGAYDQKYPRRNPILPTPFETTDVGFSELPAEIRIQIYAHNDLLRATHDLSEVPATLLAVKPVKVLFEECQAIYNQENMTVCVKTLPKFYALDETAILQLKAIRLVWKRFPERYLEFACLQLSPYKSEALRRNHLETIIIVFMQMQGAKSNLREVEDAIRALAGASDRLRKVALRVNVMVRAEYKVALKAVMAGLFRAEERAGQLSEQVLEGGDVVWSWEGKERLKLRPRPAISRVRSR